ncbi:MAG: bifunctional glutamate N-acetyltransferase/amino-acid acetyltransferase ArgJ [Treponema sp.]|jgi:glutamate N-acetyltransferase/amino-acid N-acetyltransferase|nr:bifunctional glutamate N-acetyltransferase/amino-acid acetyltransferase ArgJ [Treponema sp.]
MKEISGGVCAPRGFRAGGVWCGIKAGSQKRDLGLIYSEQSCAAAALFTANRVKAASVLVSREHLASGRLRAVIANSGNANACTGEPGLAAARRMAELAAAKLSAKFSGKPLANILTNILRKDGGIGPADVAVASTGVIGVPLPVEAIENGMDALVASLSRDEAGHAAALESIMTTDTRKKDGALEFDLGGVPVRIGGMAKGSGMIHPNMATMLCFMTTDAALSPPLLDLALRRAVNRSFNRVTVDGDTSTNDTIILMANGAAGNHPLAREGPDWECFAEALERLCVKMARAMARDGEGASRLMTVTVSGAVDEESAALLAKAVASSSLVKAACCGADANWGRVLCALGYAGVDFDPAAVDVAFQSAAGKVAVCRGGVSLPFSEDAAKKILSAEEIEILVELGGPQVKAGGAAATVWGCDLTCDYVKINGDYRS